MLCDNRKWVFWRKGNGNSVNLFRTIAKELHSSLDLFDTLRMANELQQHGNSSSSELTSRRTAALFFCRELYTVPSHYEEYNLENFWITSVQLEVNIQCTYVQTCLSQQLLNEQKQHQTQTFKQHVRAWRNRCAGQRGPTLHVLFSLVRVIFSCTCYFHLHAYMRPKAPEKT